MEETILFLLHGGKFKDLSPEAKVNLGAAMLCNLMDEVKTFKTHDLELIDGALQAHRAQCLDSSCLYHSKTVDKIVKAYADYRRVVDPLVQLLAADSSLN